LYVLQIQHMKIQTYYMLSIRISQNKSSMRVSFSCLRPYHLSHSLEKNIWCKSQHFLFLTLFSYSVYHVCYHIIQTLLVFFPQYIYNDLSSFLTDCYVELQSPQILMLKSQSQYIRMWLYLEIVSLPTVTKLKLSP
jgi:hypothetical protein